jgi:hypothetical protein
MYADASRQPVPAAEPCSILNICDNNIAMGLHQILLSPTELVLKVELRISALVLASATRHPRHHSTNTKPLAWLVLMAAQRPISTF